MHDMTLKNVLVGEQCDKNGDILPRDVYRYWDDIVVAEEYVGPIGDTPVSPAGLKVEMGP